MSTLSDHLTELRRDLHRHPEPGWREFYTTARIVEELERIGVDEVHVGPDALDSELRFGVPDESEFEPWRTRAEALGVDPETLSRIGAGETGCVAVVGSGEPVVGLRVDIDALPITEADTDHLPADDAFRSEHEGYMHACGHDAHATIGLGVIERLKGEFDGTLKVFFQPAEELIGGGKAMAESGHLDDVEYLLSVHVGLDHPTGEVVAGIDGFLAVSHVEAEFRGQSAHAGARPEEGKNAILAMATAVQNLYGIPRHADGETRVNAGKVGGGTASNIVAEHAFVEAEVRGETTELMTYMREHADRILRAAAEMHDCEVEIRTEGEAPSAVSDEELVEVVADVAREVDGVDTVLDRATLGGSEDATYLMQAVQEGGGYAAYVGIGTDHPGGHHTPTFDVDERSIGIGIDTLSGAVERIVADRP
ncbi:amidohydrolase [Natronorarus salvus]|uniref:amidohydrolase n=1 Tax=Natronorarus salvus TaxID=3117733 RepID=UPI002F2629C5